MDLFRLQDNLAQSARAVRIGGQWRTSTILRPMSTSWLPDTSQGRMFGDYIATTVLAGGNAVTVIPVAAAPSGSTFATGMYSPAGGMPIVG